jgi:hypothetical protein
MRLHAPAYLAQADPCPGDRKSGVVVVIVAVLELSCDVHPESSMNCESLGRLPCPLLSEQYCSLFKLGRRGGLETSDCDVMRGCVQRFPIVAAILIGLAIWFAVGSPLNHAN